MSASLGGLGDVYKRQGPQRCSAIGGLAPNSQAVWGPRGRGPQNGRPSAVSYTHLTLPTIGSV
eukprot:2548308-Alexandrium_andersonii.AAC.1